MSITVTQKYRPPRQVCSVPPAFPFRIAWILASTTKSTCDVNLGVVDTLCLRDALRVSARCRHQRCLALRSNKVKRLSSLLVVFYPDVLTLFDFYFVWTHRYQGAGKKQGQDVTDPCLLSKRCQVKACDIQWCLSRSNYQQHKCQEFIDAWNECCRKAVAQQQAKAHEGGS